MKMKASTGSGKRGKNMVEAYPTLQSVHPSGSNMYISKCLPFRPLHALALTLDVCGVPARM